MNTKYLTHAVVETETGRVVGQGHTALNARYDATVHGADLAKCHAARMTDEAAGMTGVATSTTVFRSVLNDAFVTRIIGGEPVVMAWHEARA